MTAPPQLDVMRLLAVGILIFLVGSAEGLGIGCQRAQDIDLQKIEAAPQLVSLGAIDYNSIICWITVGELTRCFSANEDYTPWNSDRRSIISISVGIGQQCGIQRKGMNIIKANKSLIPCVLC